MNDPRLASRTVLVTGGNSGIGAAAVRAFAAQGARVVLHFLDAPVVAAGIGHAVAGRTGAEAIADEVRAAGGIDADLERRVLPSIPMGRLGTPQDIADAILFLASKQASWITGQVIRVAGGHAL